MNSLEDLTCLGEPRLGGSLSSRSPTSMGYDMLVTRPNGEKNPTYLGTNHDQAHTEFYNYVTGVQKAIFSDPKKAQEGWGKGQIVFEFRQGGGDKITTTETVRMSTESGTETPDTNQPKPFVAPNEGPGGIQRKAPAFDYKIPLIISGIAAALGVTVYLVVRK